MWKLITHILKFTLQTFTKKAFSLLKISRDLWWAISIPHENRLLWGIKRLGLLIQLQMKAAKATFLQFLCPYLFFLMKRTWNEGKIGKYFNWVQFLKQLLQVLLERKWPRLLIIVLFLSEQWRKKRKIAKFKYKWGINGKLFFVQFNSIWNHPGLWYGCDFIGNFSKLRTV